jgi:hypothetical protein
LDIAKGEKVEGELDILIERRHEARRVEEGQRRIEELWMPSERACFERLEEQKRQERLEFHEAHANRLRNTLEGLISYHEREADRYREDRNGHRGEGTT